MAKAKKIIAEESIKAVNAAYGAGSIMMLGDNDTMGVACIPTGSLILDAMLGGGIPRGRIVEIYAPESVGKTTLVLHICAEEQKQGGIVAIVDAEHALDPGWAKKIGLDLSSCLIAQPDSGEQGLDIVDKLVDCGEASLIVVDSVAALTPIAEIEGSMGDAHVGLLARLMGQACRKLTAKLNNAKTTVIFINQIREKIGITYGSNETQPGGRALKFFASQRIDMRRVGQLKDGETVIGHTIKVKSVKNKIAPPLQECQISLYYDRGICPAAELLDLALTMKIITMSGSWFKLGDEQIGQGKTNTRKRLLEDADLVARIKEKAGLI